MNSFNVIESKRNQNGFSLLALIDPDVKNDLILKNIIERINKSIFDAILVGGSFINDNKFEDRIDIIKNNTNLPIILFPGSSKQLTDKIDTVLYLNLISGRNPKYLIEEQVKGAQRVKALNLNTIPTAYILLDGGNVTTVQTVSETKPLSMDDKNQVLSHALAGQYLGNHIIYFDCGSGSKNIMDYKLLKFISTNINIPIMVGGGIKNKYQIDELVRNGASYIVIGNILENEEKLNI